MKTYKQGFYLPVTELDSFKRFFKKLQKNVKDVMTSFGTMTVHKILTTKGYEVERCGVIPIEEKDGKKFTKFYSIIRNINKYGTQLDRATKNPKRGKNYIEL